MNQLAVVIRPEIAPGRRVIAISDIHGNLPFLKGVLEKANFSPADVLVLVGDLFEKGRDSLGTLRYILELQQTHTVYPLCGNCDGLVLRFFETTSTGGSWRIGPGWTSGSGRCSAPGGAGP